MSALHKRPENRGALVAWVLTILGLSVLPSGLLLADRVQAPWWTLGLWISAAGSALFVWGLVWVALHKAQATRKTARALAASFALILAGATIAREVVAQTVQGVDLVAIVLVTHLVAAGLVLVCLGSDILHTMTADHRRAFSSWTKALLLVALGLFAVGWTLKGLAAWRFSALVATGASCFLADYIYRRLSAGA